MNNKTAINTYLSTTESKKQSKQEEQRQNHGYRQRFDGCQMEGECGEKTVVHLHNGILHSRKK